MKNISFNKQQQEAVDVYEGAVSVVASAGSGKSTILVGRINNLITKHGVDPKEILAVTFTRDTSVDLTNKINDLGHSNVNVGTFHAICGRILRSEGVFFNRYNQIKLFQIENLFKKMNRQVDTKVVMEFIDFQKNHGIKPDEPYIEKESIYQEFELKRYYQAYEDFKKKNNLHDFNDYLTMTLDIVKKKPNKYTFEHVLVDENQDTNAIQHELLTYWVRDNNIFSVSDFRQNLFEFRGSDTKYSLNFEDYWENPRLLNVSTNYRSTKDIIDNANQFIKKYYGHLDQYEDAVAHNKGKSNIVVKSHLNEHLESEYIGKEIQELVDSGVDLNEIAVLYRNNAQGMYIEGELMYREIPYDIASSGSFFKRKEVAGILSVLRLIQDIEDDSAFEYIYNSLRAEPLKFFSKKTLTNIQKKANDENCCLFDALPMVQLSGHESRQDVNKFINIMEDLADFSTVNNSVEDLIEEVIEQFKIRELIRENYDNVDDRDERLLSIDVLKKFVKNMRLSSFINFAYSSDEVKDDDGSPKIKLKTAHSSKGLEYEYVFIISIKDGTFPSDRATILEEARLFYVAITRSKKNLWLSEIGEANRFTQEYLGKPTEAYFPPNKNNPLGNKPKVIDSRSDSDILADILAKRK